MNAVGLFIGLVVVIAVPMAVLYGVVRWARVPQSDEGRIYRPGIVTAIGLLVVLGLVLMYLSVFRQNQTDWHTVDGIVTAVVPAQVTQNGVPMRVFRTTYTYGVIGNDFSGSSELPTAQYTTDETVTVYYDRANPASSTLINPLRVEQSAIVFLIAAVGVGIFTLWAAVITTRRSLSYRRKRATTAA